MKPLGMRQWLLLSWLLCLGLPRLLFEVVQQLQHAVLPSLSGPGWLVGPLATALLTAGLTLLGVGWLLNHWLLRPLAAIERAARQIAAGTIDVALPRSQVREINAVAAAFEALGDGLRAAVQRQAASEQERRLLISAVAHDLRTPLFALRGYLAGIEGGVAATPERAAHYLAQCRAQADVLEQRVGTLFDYTRLEYLEQPPIRQAVCWNEVVQQSIARLRPAAAQKQIALGHAGPATPCELRGDSQLLARMLDNLLENAVRHTPSGGTVSVGWEATPTQVRFSVTDTGPGIAPASLPFVFEPLYRGDAAPDGAGLGLATAQRVAKLHGGDLRAANRPGAGAELTGWLSYAARE